jgi:transcriptional regulator with XRE-family HTH domain
LLRSCSVHDTMHIVSGSIEINREKLKQLRRERALSQRALSHLSSVSLDAVNQLETGKRQAQPTTVRRLAEALGVEPKELIKEE